MSSLPLIIGHRGASALAPENTLAAFRRAIADGADGIEFDVRLSRDGIAVVIHDASLERTGLIRRRVAELTAAELQLTDVGSWFRDLGSRGLEGSDQRGEDEGVPLLQQVFDLLDESEGLLYLEMKAEVGGGSKLAAEVVRMIQQAGSLCDRVIVECFDLPLLQEVKRLDSTIRTAALFEPKISQPASFLRRNFAQLAQAAGAEEIALHHALASARIIERSLRLNQRVVVWTVDDPAWVAKAKSLGVSALITNNPAALFAVRNSTNV